MNMYILIYFYLFSVIYILTDLDIYFIFLLFLSLACVMFVILLSGAYFIVRPGVKVFFVGLTLKFLPVARICFEIAKKSNSLLLPKQQLPSI